jgi:uncharacterized OsmC-like protein
MNYFYYSDNHKKDSIDIKSVVLALEGDDREDEAYYYIHFVLTHGAKIRWEYYFKELRDKEIKEIRELKHTYRDTQKPKPG